MHFLWGYAEVNNEENSSFAGFGLNVLLDLLDTKILVHRVVGGAEGTSPGLGVSVFSGPGADAGLALGALKRGCFDDLGFGEERGVEVAKGHDDLVCGVAGGG